MGTAHIQINKLFLEDPESIDFLEDNGFFKIIEKGELKTVDDVESARCLIESKHLPSGYQGEGVMQLEMQNDTYSLLWIPKPKLH